MTAATLALVLFVAACAPFASVDPPFEAEEPNAGAVTFTPHESAEGIPDRLTSDAEKIADFGVGAPSAFYWADGYSNGGNFDCVWSKDNASIEYGVMTMSVARRGVGYGGAEYRTDKRYSYGFYAVSMKAADCSGVISSFFAYTNDPVWDEIDIEFLGKDMSRVQFNYFKSGVGGHEFVFDLGFDASKEFHEYAFDWQPEYVTWYIDGKAVYRAVKDIPSHSMQIMMNVWNCKGADDWSGKFDTSALPALAQYKWFAYSEH